MRQLAFLILLVTALACNNADDGKGTEWTAIQDLQPPRKTPGGELRVKGSMEYGDPSGNPRLERRSPQGFNPKILMLDVVPPTDAKGRKVFELTFTEGLQTEDQHTSVEVYYKGEKIADMKIEKVH